MTKLRKGWIKRQFDNVELEVKQWPKWMRGDLIAEPKNLCQARMLLGIPGEIRFYEVQCMLEEDHDGEHWSDGEIEDITYNLTWEEDE